jgi:fructose-specific phosphotransferase system IIC component
MQRFWPALAVPLGLVIAYVDSRPTWDDTGVTAGVLFLSAMAFGYAEPRKPWLAALAVGVWIPLWAAVHTQNYGAFIALVPAFVGAYVGMALRKWLSPVEA